MRDTIFISHATPEDNDFSIWLANRLQLLGYKVWLDKNGLLGGEKFWEEIDQVIRNKAIKILMVYSKNICQRDEFGNIIEGKLKDGISKEISLSESIGKTQSLNDFIILMNIDGAKYNLFIGADRLNQIPFYDNWADGFKQLEKKLRHDEVLKEDSNITDFGNWYENQFILPNSVHEKKELYYTNWWSIDNLPKSFFVYHFDNKSQADIISKQWYDFPKKGVSNNIFTFEKKNSFLVQRDEDEIEIIPKKIYEVFISDIYNRNISEEFPNQRDCENYLKQLLSRIFHELMKKRGLDWYEMSSKKNAYFHNLKSLPTQKVKYQLKNSSKPKTKNLIGKYKSFGKWHFAITARPILFPVLCFNLKSHITFTSNGFKVWEKGNKVDTEKLHSHRRAKGKRMFNEEWRDIFLAFISSLKIDEEIKLPLSSNFTLTMNDSPIEYWANFGYKDPKDLKRESILNSDFNDNDDENE